MTERPSDPRPAPSDTPSPAAPGPATSGPATHGPAAVARRNAAVRAAVAQGLVGPGDPLVALLDVTGIRAGARALHTAFDQVTAPGARVLHTFAVKACPLVAVVRLLRDEGVGAEVASPGELALARVAGTAAAHTVLDSPAKTPAELREALTLGIAVNADGRQELARLDELVDRVGGDDIRALPPLGLRVNPQVGAGSIDALSTATATAKFGVALRDPGARDWVVRAFLDRPWLTRLHVHTGSQGVPLELMAEGVAQTYALAEEVNARAGRQQVDTVDIGGGLPVDFTSDERGPGFEEYARLLAHRVPGLFDGRYGLVTEFGRALVAKHGLVLTRVEYTKSAGGRRIAVTHAGAQIAARTVYAPEQWPLRVASYDAQGLPSTGSVEVQDVAGPACFAGDLLARGRALPLLAPGDHVAALDTGGYAFAHPYAYNSLPRPAVHGFLIEEDGARVRFARVRAAQTISEVVAESGGAYGEGLLF
ncbi:diaminopimelate decarboxylase [Streptomyces sp. NPDC059816]|uniref:diaminopimelate decarboxylase n=1 Tax=Streptomyces sp. NPDC059816 TaxID=3346960 RepID=UPI00364D6749